MRLNLEFKVDKETNKVTETKGLEDLFELFEQGYELTLVKPAEVKEVFVTFEIK